VPLANRHTRRSCLAALLGNLSNASATTQRVEPKALHIYDDSGKPLTAPLAERRWEWREFATDDIRDLRFGAYNGTITLRLAMLRPTDGNPVLFKVTGGR
jgi:hypothetical protein